MSLNGDYGLAMEECLDHWIVNGSPSWEVLIELVEKYEKSTGEAMRMRLNIGILYLVWYVMKHLDLARKSDLIGSHI